MKDEVIINLLSDIANFNLSIFGISVTVFTVLYAFLLSKKDFIKELNELIKQDKAQFYAIQKVSFALVHMRRWKSLNNHIAIVAFSSFFLYLFAITSKYINCNLLSVRIALPLTFLLAIYLILMLVSVFRIYSKETSMN